MPPSLAIIYFSATEHTAQLADAIRRAAADHVEVREHRIAGAEIVSGRFRKAAALELVDTAAGVIFGSPTFMGGPAAEFKAFADATSDRWTEQRWKDKVAAGLPRAPAQTGTKATLSPTSQCWPRSTE